MFRLHQIESFDAPALAPYRSMRKQWEHYERGIFVAEGEKVVRRLLESPLTVSSVLLPAKWLSEYEPLLQRRAEDMDVYVAEKDVLEQLTGFSMYQGVLAAAKLPPAVSLDAVLRQGVRPYFLVAVDGLSNAENMGVLVRNAVAFGAQALLVGETCASPYLRRAVRSSMGAVFKLPVVSAASLENMLGEVRGHRIKCLAAHPHTEERTLYDTDLAGDCCVVFGSEGLGISAAVLAACDEAVSIPMHAGIDSLNVGSAAAAFLNEAARQRRNSEHRV